MLPDTLKGSVIKSTGSWYRVITDSGKTVACKLRGKFRLEGSKATNPLAVGDRVDISIEDDNGTGIIEGIDERKNHIIRKATRLSKQTHVIAANIDQAILIVTLAYPRTSTGFIDRFLVTCEAYSIPAAIVFNKYDIIEGSEAEEVLSDFMQLYRDIGYSCIHTSATKGTNLEAFNDLLKNKTSLLSGHSGTGKSALINAIEPGLNLKVRPISRVHRKGKHTTTFAEMFLLSNGGYIIDTPGIKEFGLAGMEAWEVCHYFPEMRAYFNECRFDNCTHYNEPGCRVKEEVEAGNISISRYENYLNMLLGEETRG